MPQKIEIIVLRRRERPRRVAQRREGQPAVGLHQAIGFLKRPENMAQGSIDEFKDRYPLSCFVAADPFQHPLQLAILGRMFKNFAALSNGRFRLGVGIGWNRTEFESLGAGDRFGHNKIGADQSIGTVLFNGADRDKNDILLI